MLETVEATIDTLGNVKLLENVKLGRKHKALVTILDDEPEYTNGQSMVGSIEILDEDLESGSAEITEMFNRSIQRSAKELDQQ